MLKRVQFTGIFTVVLLCAGLVTAALLDESFEAANGFTDGGGIDGVNGWIMPAGAITAETHQASAGFAVRDGMALRPSATGGYIYPYRNFAAQTEGVVEASIFFNFNGNSGDTRAGFYLNDGVGGNTGTGKIRVTAFGNLSGASQVIIYWKDAAGNYEKSTEQVAHAMGKSTWQELRVRYDTLANEVSWDIRPEGGGWTNLGSAVGSGTPFVPSRITFETYAGAGALPSTDDCLVSVTPLPPTYDLLYEHCEPEHGFSDGVILGGINDWTGYSGVDYGNYTRVFDSGASFAVRDTLAATVDQGGPNPNHYSLPYHDFALQSNGTVVVTAYFNLNGNNGDTRVGFYFNDGNNTPYGTGRIRMIVFGNLGGPTIRVRWINASGVDEKVSEDISYTLSKTAWYQVMVRYDLDGNQVSWHVRPQNGAWAKLGSQAGSGTMFLPKRITLEMYCNSGNPPSIDDIMIGTTLLPPESGTLILVQ